MEHAFGLEEMRLVEALRNRDEQAERLDPAAQRALLDAFRDWKSH